LYFEEENIALLFEGIYSHYNTNLCGRRNCDAYCAYQV